MTFEVNGKQYVAIASGPSRIARGRLVNTPELKDMRHATVPQRSCNPPIYSNEEKSAGRESGACARPAPNVVMKDTHWAVRPRLPSSIIAASGPPVIAGAG